jgi:hypothetical protein
VTDEWQDIVLAARQHLESKKEKLQTRSMKKEEQKKEHKEEEQRWDELPILSHLREEEEEEGV